jgi:hypothetical protein
MIERRRLLLIPAITITIGSFQYSLENGAAKAEFTDSECSISIPSFENRQVLPYFNTYALNLLDFFVNMVSVINNAELS